MDLGEDSDEEEIQVGEHNESSDSDEIQTRKKVAVQSSNQDYTNSLDMMQMQNQGQKQSSGVKDHKASDENSRIEGYVGENSTDHSDYQNNFADAEDMIGEIRSRIEEEKEKILLMKTKYIQKLDDKNELEKLLAKCINDYKEELWAIKSKMKFVNGMGGEAGSKAGAGKATGDENFEMEIKQTIREILNIEKQLSLLYDKVFYTKGHVNMAVNGPDAHMRMC